MNSDTPYTDVNVGVTPTSSPETHIRIPEPLNLEMIEQPEDRDGNHTSSKTNLQSEDICEKCTSLCKCITKYVCCYNGDDCRVRTYLWLFTIFVLILISFATIWMTTILK